MTKLLTRQDYNDCIITVSTGLERYTYFIRDIEGKVLHMVYLPRTENQLLGYQQCYDWIEQKRTELSN